MSINPNALDPLRRRMIEDMTIRRSTVKTLWRSEVNRSVFRRRAAFQTRADTCDTLSRS